MTIVREHGIRKLQPFKDCPIWARLQFIKDFAETTFPEDPPGTHRKMSEVLVNGFYRVDPLVIYIDFEIPCISGDGIVTEKFYFPLCKVFS